MIELDDCWVFANEEEMREWLKSNADKIDMRKAEAEVKRLHDLEATFRYGDGFDASNAQNVFTDLLEPCPFCGSDKAYIQVRSLFESYEARVVCASCHVSTSHKFRSSPCKSLLTGEDFSRTIAIEDAIKEWNRRVDG